MLTLSDGAQVTIPADGLASGVDIELSVRNAPPLPEGYEALSDVYTLLPHGQRFLRPVQISFPYTAAGFGEVVVLRLDDDSDATWDEADNVTVLSDTVHMVAGQFCHHVVARRLAEIVEVPQVTDMSHDLYRPFRSVVQFEDLEVTHVHDGVRVYARTPGGGVFQSIALEVYQQSLSTAGINVGDRVLAAGIVLGPHGLETYVLLRTGSGAPPAADIVTLSEVGPSAEWDNALIEVSAAQTTAFSDASSDATWAVFLDSGPFPVTQAFHSSSMPPSAQSISFVRGILVARSAAGPSIAPRDADDIGTFTLAP